MNGADDAAGVHRGAPVRYYFVVDRVPAGEAPEPVRRAWLGLVLPVRHDRPVEGPFPFDGTGIETHRRMHVDDAVVVSYPDALAALSDAGQSGAAAYWEVRWEAHPFMALAFDVREGRLLPPEAARRILDLPEHD